MLLLDDIQDFDFRFILLSFQQKVDALYKMLHLILSQRSEVSFQDGLNYILFILQSVTTNVIYLTFYFISAEY